MTLRIKPTNKKSKLYKRAYGAPFVHLLFRPNLYGAPFVHLLFRPNYLQIMNFASPSVNLLFRNNELARSVHGASTHYL